MDELQCTILPPSRVLRQRGGPTCPCGNGGVGEPLRGVHQGDQHVLILIALRECVPAFGGKVDRGVGLRGPGPRR